MNITKNINKIINVLFAICLISALMIFSKDSLLLLLSIPILLAAINLNYKKGGFLSILLVSVFIAYLFIDIENLGFEIVPILLLTLILIVLLKTSISDKGQIAINFLLASIVFIGLYKYQMIYQGLDLSTMADDLKQMVEQSTDYKLDSQAYELSLAMYPAILSSISLLYSFASLKLVRNYMAYKSKGNDIASLNTIRISKRDLVMILIFAIAVDLLVPSLFSIRKDYVLANIVWIFLSLMVANGMLTYDYIISSRKSNLTRGMQWFFAIIFFYFFAIVFMILGFADIFLDFREKRRKVYGQK